MNRLVMRLMVLILIVSACARSAASETNLPDLPPITGQELQSNLEDLGRPAVVNVWASWCPPCRSEAPLLKAAQKEFGDRVEFIGVDVQDNQIDAKAFISEFGLSFNHFFDRDRSVPNYFGGVGTPVTFFFDSEGTLVDTHLGVIDGRGLALGIDEILGR